MQTLSIVFVEGWQAGYDGGRDERNPHDACQKKRQVWWSGWIEGSSEREAEACRRVGLHASLPPVAAVVVV